MPFNSGPRHVRPGDILNVSVQGDKVLSHEVTQTGIWTGVIEFLLDGNLNYILGNEETLKWIEGFKS